MRISDDVVTKIFRRAYPTSTERVKAIGSTPITGANDSWHAPIVTGSNVYYGIKSCKRFGVKKNAGEAGETVVYEIANILGIPVVCEARLLVSEDLVSDGWCSRNAAVIRWCKGTPIYTFCTKPSDNALISLGQVYALWSVTLTEDRHEYNILYDTERDIFVSIDHEASLVYDCGGWSPSTLALSYAFRFTRDERPNETELRRMHEFIELGFSDTQDKIKAKAGEIRDMIHCFKPFEHLRLGHIGQDYAATMRKSLESNITGQLGRCWG